MQSMLFAAATIIIASRLCFTVSEEPKRFDGYKLIEVSFKSKEELDYGRQLFGNDADYWAGPSVAFPTHVLIPPLRADFIIEHLRERGYPTTVINDNIQKSIDQEKAENEAQKLKNNGKIAGTFPVYSQICPWLKQMETSYPMLASYIEIGRSHEGRIMCMITLGNKGVSNKKTIFMEWGIHAREWLSPATALWLVDYLLKNYVSDTGAQSMLDKASWNWVIAANPDGYDYTHTTNRNWRKTRSGPISGCYGTDPNRNYDYAFAGEGTSSNPCSDTYHGPFAFSEVETQVLRNTSLALKPIKFYAAMHTYVPAILTPYGYTDLVIIEPQNGVEHKRVGRAMAAAINAVNGQNFRVGNSAELLYAAAGASDDWTIGTGTAEFACTIELRAGSLGGFVASVSDIVPSARELLAGFVVLAREIS